MAYYKLREEGHDWRGSEGSRQTKSPPRIDRLRGLSGKVLALAILFVMIGELLIFMPSLANYRVSWLKGRIAMAEVAALAVEAAPDNRISDDLRKELLSAAGVEVLALKRDQSRHLMLMADKPPTVVARYDLRDTRIFQLLFDAVTTMLAGGQRIITVVDKPPNMSGDEIEACHERGAALRRHGRLRRHYPRFVGAAVDHRRRLCLHRPRPTPGRAHPPPHPQHGPFSRATRGPEPDHRAFRPQ